MARPRAFDRDQVLDIAVDVFREKGFDGTTTDDLVNAMKIGRQSLYATFGDKRSLYLEALRRYNTDSVTDQVATAGQASSPLGGIEAVLMRFVGADPGRTANACLGVSAICEFGTSDADIQRINQDSGRSLHRFLERTLGEARELGEIAPSVEPKAAAQFIAATLMGMKVAARAGADPATLQNIAQLAMRSLSH